MLIENRRNGDLLYEQVADHIVKLIDKGTLQPGERLPSIRKLSGQMDVSISTVLQAYMVLEGKDWIEAKPQSGFYVRPSRNLPPEPKASTPSSVVARVGVSAVSYTHLRAHETPEHLVCR